MEIIEEPGLRAPIKTWLPPAEIETGAMEQLRNAARHPDVGPAVAVMPDCHVGFGVTIGCVFPTVGGILPSAVGVDIGCGMCAVNTGVTYKPKRHDARFWGDWATKVRSDGPPVWAFQRFRSTPVLADASRRPSRLNVTLIVFFSCPGKL